VKTNPDEFWDIQPIGFEKRTPGVIATNEIRGRKITTNFYAFPPCGLTKKEIH